MAVSIFSRAPPPLCAGYQWCLLVRKPIRKAGMIHASNCGKSIISGFYAERMWLYWRTQSTVNPGRRSAPTLSAIRRIRRPFLRRDPIPPEVSCNSYLRCGSCGLASDRLKVGIRVYKKSNISTYYIIWAKMYTYMCNIYVYIYMFTTNYIIIHNYYI